MKFIAWFNEIKKTDVPVAGGKGANLGEMTNAGFPVPPGFVVTAQAYKYFIETTAIAKEIYEISNNVNINDNDALDRAAKKIQSIILSENVPKVISDEIINAYHNLMIGNKFEGLSSKALELVSVNKTKQPFVAVRSSATAEDLSTASFAGQQESYLNVRGDSDVINAVKKVWASLFTPRAIFYRKQNNFPIEKVLIAVIVQKMVDSEKSGVAFSVHPATGNKNEIVIEAGWGLGEYIVKGIINPDNYVVDKNTFEIKHKLVKRQEKMLTRDPLTGKNIEVEIPDQKQEKQVLDDEQIITLAKVVKKIEDHYNYPQDIEWASENNRLYIVQSRPVTFFGKKEEKEVKETGEVIVEGLGASPGRAVGRAVIIHGANELDKVKKGDVLVTTMTDPDMVPAMERAAAIVTDEGGLTSHAAIVSRELGVPAVVGTVEATKKITEGELVTVDADKGIVLRGGEIVDKAVASAKSSIAPAPNYSAPVTGTKILMNLGIPEKILDYANLPFDGIGLMRIEFLIASRIKVHPLKAIKEGRSQEYVNKLAEGIAKVAGAIKPRFVVVRFSDFKTNEYADLEGGKEYEPTENNPMLGWRGCSRYVSQEFEKAFRLECRAIKKVRDAGLTNVWAMLPFVRNTAEVKKIIEIMRSEGLERGPNFKLYLMAEVPSAIILADEFSKLCDGFSIGSNDLTQLILGVDRDSTILGRMGYFDARSEAVKRAIKDLIRVAHENNVTVSICGQAPSEYPEFTEFLINEGIDSVSVNPDVVVSTRELVSSVEKRLLLKLAREKGEIKEELKEEMEAHVEPLTHENEVENESFRTEEEEGKEDSFWP